MFKPEHTFLSLITAAIVLGCCLVIPNGAPIRLQQATNLQFILFALTGTYVLWAVSKSVGLLILYATFESLRGVGSEVLPVMVLLSIFYTIVVVTASYWWHNRGVLYDGLIAIAGLNLLFQTLQYFHVYLLSSPVSGSDPSALPGLMSNVDETFALYLTVLPAFFRRHRWQLLIPVAVAGLILCSPVVSSRQTYNVMEHISGRYDVWAAMVQDAARSLWIGNGFKHFAFINETTREVFTEAHNEYIEWFWRGGVVGVVILFTALSRAIYKAFDSPDKIPALGLVAAGISAMGFFSLHIVPTALLTVLWLAMARVQAGQK